MAKLDLSWHISGQSQHGIIFVLEVWPCLQQYESEKSTGNPNAWKAQSKRPGRAAIVSSHVTS